MEQKTNFNGTKSVCCCDRQASLRHYKSDQQSCITHQLSLLLRAQQKLAAENHKSILTTQDHSRNALGRPILISENPDHHELSNEWRLTSEACKKTNGRWVQQTLGSKPTQREVTAHSASAGLQQRKASKGSCQHAASHCCHKGAEDWPFGYLRCFSFVLLFLLHPPLPSLFHPSFTLTRILQSSFHPSLLVIFPLSSSPFSFLDFIIEPTPSLLSSEYSLSVPLMILQGELRRKNRRAKAARPVISAPLAPIPESELPTALRRHPHFVVLPGGTSQVVRRNAIRRPAPPTGPPTKNSLTSSVQAPKNTTHCPPMSPSNVDSSSLPLPPVPQASNVPRPAPRADLPLDESMDDLRYYLAELYFIENDPT
ncbi:hypothetical protein VP01_1771g3 [Puccinia sorghi]|uniref:Uncharacterized protein n=1 Tax=Puccinia sorghi TaxID=27349 RepID=A0A0L6VEQ6_9BASI|nr:hypothetical protein VP01_1771g3 [Puccinia sorghi]